MLILLGAPVLAATLSELAHVRYLHDTRRRDEAIVEAARLVAADPTDAAAQLQYIKETTESYDFEPADLLRVYADWHAANPDHSLRRLTFAYATARAARTDRWDEGLPKVPGPWCDDVLALLEPVPTEPPVATRALSLRIATREVCGGDNAADLAALAVLAKTEDRAKFYHVANALYANVVDESLADDVVALLAVDPWRMSSVWGLYSKAMTGAGKEHARAAVLEVARNAATTSDEPALLYEAWEVFRRADLDSEADAVARKLRKLDPKVGGVYVSSPAPSGPKREPLPAVVGTPEQRLAASDARRSELSNAWSRGRWHAERAELLAEMGRERESLDHLQWAYRFDPGIRSNLDFAREAVKQKRKLASARFAATIAVSTRREWSIDNKGWSIDADRAALAEALLVRARVLRALDLPRKSAIDAKLALQVRESAEARLLLGLALSKWNREEAAFEQLVQGLARPAGADPELVAEAHSVALALWAQAGRWTPTGLDGWIAVVAASQPEGESLIKPVELDPADRPAFPDLSVIIEGKPVLLSTIDGPIVVDLWATWCGPCIAAMPELDRAARTTEGVTFLAVSVDTEQATAEGFFKDQTPSFTVGWAGWGAMETLGIHGIPTAYFLDEQHRIAAVKKGFSSDDSEFIEALALLTTKP